MNTIQAITKLIFVSNKIESSDVIIVPGASFRQLTDKAAELFKQGNAKYIVLTGGFNERLKRIESEGSKEILIKKGVPKNSILSESISTNTKENAIEALKVIKNAKIDFNKIILISKNHHARRLLMTFSKYFINSQLLICPVSDDRNITKDNWTENCEKINIVMGEVGKIGEYYLKGNIEINR